MNIFSSLILLTGLSLILATGCSQPGQKEKLMQWMSQNGKVKVLCTTSMISDLVQEIGGESIDCLTLIQGESDPHSYQLIKGDDEKFARADIIFYNGLGLEHSPSLSNQLRHHPKAYAVGDYVRQVRTQDILLINNGIDPHIWMDVSLWNETVPFIADKLAQTIPQEKATFSNRAKSLSSKLSDLHVEMKKHLLELPDSARYLVTSHEAFNYFTRAYLCLPGEKGRLKWKERCMAPEGLAPDSQLSTVDIQKLVDYIIKHQVATLFSESNVSHDSLKKLVDACAKNGFNSHVDKSPLYADAMGPSGSPQESYLGMMQSNYQVVLQGLQEASHARSRP